MKKKALGERLKEFAKEDGRSMVWFHRKYIKDEIKISYPGFMSQVNGYASISESVKNQILNYING